MRLAVLGSSESPYVRTLLRETVALDRPSLRAECIGFDCLSAQTRNGCSSTSISQFDAIVVRTMPLGSLEQVIFRMDCLQLLEAAGTLVVNPPKALEIAIDKWLTLHRLQLAELPVPDTIACQSRDEAVEAFQKLGGDCVVKPIFGGEGRGLLRIQEMDMAWRVFSTLQQLRSVLYVQQFQPHFGYDVRVLFVGKRVFAMRREAAPGNWKTNVSQGSQCVPHDLTDEQLSLARRAADAIGGDFLGVDLLPCRDGSLKILEVNAVPGWKGIERATGENIGRRMIEFIVKRVEERATANE